MAIERTFLCGFQQRANIIVILRTFILLSINGCLRNQVVNSYYGLILVDSGSSLVPISMSQGRSASVDVVYVG